uniref:Importin N-terminal domain-containing protein n=1 Tax=Globisporangium ultimum (strain ATCC 200006 / CBS 805.95 / DAOM BR144) TaxID=431595 RepID=K3WXC2_GLOUD
MATTMADANDWEKLLWSLMAMDNSERNRAEMLFAELKQQSDSTLLGLVQIVHSSRSDDVRGLAAVLLRRVLLRDAVSLWPNASDHARQIVKQELLAVLSTEQNRSIRRKVCDTVGELASSILDDAQWDDLLPTLLQWIETPNTTLRETTLRVFEMIAIYIATMIEASFGDDPHAQFEVTVLTMLVQCINDSEGRVALNAIRALSMLLINMETIQIQREDLLRASIPSILAAMHRMLHAQQFEEVMETLEVLIEVVEPHAVFFKPCLREYVETMVRISDGASGSIPDGCRQLAMEFLVSIAEHAAHSCRKISKNYFVQAVYPVAFKMMLELQDVDTWSVTNCDDEEDAALANHEISNFDVGSEALERLVGAIGAKKSLPKCFALIQEYASNTEQWVYRHAALVGLCQILEILSYENLDAIVRHLLTQAYDAHPRVCCTAIDVIGQMSVDQGPQFQDAYHAQALMILLHYLEDFSKPRLQAHAATALRQFIDMCQPHVLEPYLEKLLTQLFAILQAPNHLRVVQEQSITAISSIATVAGPAFIKYYGAVMPSLQQILLSCLHESTTTGSPGSFTLGGITLECISLIGLAVGKDTFRRESVEIMKIMAEMQNTPKIVGNEWIRTYLLQAWARCCKCLGKEFASYLPVVMPTLLFAAMQQAEFEVDPSTLDDDDDSSLSTNGDNDDIQIAQVNDRCLSIRTSILEEKATACQLLTSMVTDLEETFFPYAEQVTQVLAPLMTDSVHSDIRSSSISSMPALVKCVAIASSNSEAIKQMVDFTLGRLVGALTSEPELDLVMNIMQSMKLCISNALEHHPHVRLNEAQLKELVNGLLLVLGDSFQRRAVQRAQKVVDDGEEYEDIGRASEDGGDGYDDDDETTENLEQELQFVMGDCIGSLAKTHGEQFFPVFQAILWEKILELSAEHCLAEDRKLALYILDDVLEYCGEPAMRETDVFLPLLIDVLKSSDGYPPLVQAASYGMGICARLGRDRFAKHAELCLTLLRGVLMHPQARDPYHLNATDNAVSAFGLICEHQANVVDSATLFPQWLSLLPLRGDLEESVEVMKRLLRYVNDRNEYILGKDCSQLHVVVGIFADAIELSDAFAAQVGDDEFAKLRDEIRATLASLRVSVPEPIMTAAWGALRAPQQAALHSLFG